MADACCVCLPSPCTPPPRIWGLRFHCSQRPHTSSCVPRVEGSHKKFPRLWLGESCGALDEPPSRLVHTVNTLECAYG